MKKALILFTCFSALLLFSCKDKSVSVVADQTTMADTTVRASEQAPQGNETTITLNNGVQWEVDDKISNGVKEMQKTLNDLPSSEESRNYAALKEELEREFTETVSGTSLSGDALSQFDNYMSTIKILLEDLTSQDAATRQQAVQKMSSHLATFNNYFS